MDKESLNKIVAAILAGHAVSARSGSVHADSCVNKYEEILKELEAREHDKESKLKGKRLHTLPNQTNVLDDEDDN